MVKSRLRGGERVSLFEYRMPVGKKRLGSSIPDSWPLLGSKTLSITLCTVSRRAEGFDECMYGTCGVQYLQQG